MFHYEQKFIFNFDKYLPERDTQKSFLPLEEYKLS